MATARLANISLRALQVWRRNAEVLLTTWHINLLPPLLEPVFYVSAFGYGLGALVQQVHWQGKPLSYLQFMAPGIIAVAVMFWAFFENTYSSFVRMYYQRTFDAMIATPLLVEDVIAGEWLWGATKSFFAGTVMLGMLSLFGLVAWPAGLWVPLIALLGGFVFAAVGLIVTALSPQIDMFNLPVFLLIFPMFLFSGTFFPLEQLPSWAQQAALALPLTHVCSLVRGACLNVMPPHAAASTAYLLALAVGLGVLALR
ncbi:MAG: ABC transporter permease, partial [Pedosphaera sp.]|nr:ABC transporter permease [Pedosphaera sp.]